MSIILRAVLIWFFVFLAYLAFSTWLQFQGYLSDNAVELWSHAIIQVDGPPGFKSADAIYPPLPLLLVMLSHEVFGSDGLPLPNVVTAGAVALMATYWYRNFRENGRMGVLLAGFIVFLLATHPAFLFATSQSPESVLLCLGTWIFTRGLVQLRLTGNSPDMMKVATGLLIAGLSSTFGLLLAFASLPFLVISARPSVFISSPIGYLLAIVFPVSAAIGSLVFVSMIFDMPLFPKPEVMRSSSSTTSIVSWVLVLSFPALAACFSLRRATAHVMPLFSGGSCIIVAAIFANLQNASNDPVIACAPLVVVAAVAIRFWPPGPSRTVLGSTAVLASWLTSAALLAQSKAPEVERWVMAAIGTNVSSQSSVAVVADLLREREAIFIDAERNPELVVELGSIEGMILPGTPRFELMALGGRLNERIVVARKSSNAAVIEDRVLRRFPRIAEEPPRGYTYRFKNEDWIILERGDA